MTHQIASSQRGTLWRAALAESLTKLSPRVQYRNPLMFVVYLGSILTTLLAVGMALGWSEGQLGFTAAISLWLWFTVLFANVAEALAQADVAVAMNSGTQAAKEAGNMVDLDSNPTKLLEVVHIGKQMLMTRCSLTTFSIANDVAKYFAIIPAAFAVTYPPLNALNVMGLHSPASAILSAVIFNALIVK